MKINNKLLLLLICPLVCLIKNFTSADALTGKSLILSLNESIFNDVLYRSLVKFSLFKMEAHFNLVQSTLFVNSINKNDRLSHVHYQYQNFIIDAISRLYGKNYYQFMVMDQCHYVRENLYKTQAMAIFVDGIDGFL